VFPHQDARFKSEEYFFKKKCPILERTTFVLENPLFLTKKLLNPGSVFFNAEYNEQVFSAKP